MYSTGMPSVSQTLLAERKNRWPGAHFPGPDCEHDRLAMPLADLRGSRCKPGSPVAVPASPAHNRRGFPIQANPAPVHCMSIVPSTAKKIIANVEKVIIGKRQEVILAMTAWFCEGHILLEDVPVVAKTMLARAIAKSVGCSFKRIQCTPDLLPTDITGASIFNQKLSEFSFRQGPIFAQIVLSDEINRATPRTQAALLEAMAERCVTVDGETYSLKRPFLVIATQNPIDHEGTFPLPEAQLDRFLIRLSIGYPGIEDEGKMLQRLQKAHPIDEIGPVLTAAELTAAQDAVRDVFVD